MEEGRMPQRIRRTAKDPVKLRRAIVVLMSAQGQTVKDITTLMQVGEDDVRDAVPVSTSGGSTRRIRNRAGASQDDQ
jgi:transposase